jgi:hypothetical protein
MRAVEIFGREDALGPHGPPLSPIGDHGWVMRCNHCGIRPTPHAKGNCVVVTSIAAVGCAYQPTPQAVALMLRDRLSLRGGSNNH